MLVAAALAALVLTACGDDSDEAAGSADGMMAETSPGVTEPSPGVAEPTEPAEPTGDAMSGAEPTAEAEATEAAGDGETGESGEPGELAPGIYRAYSPDALSDPGYEQHILFFHASWCPECRAFEQAIESGPIPDGVQILKADYDAENELKERYEVTIQTTFVQVDADGEEIASWVGYGKDRSVETILDELG